MRSSRCRLVCASRGRSRGTSQFIHNEACSTTIGFRFNNIERGHGLIYASQVTANGSCQSCSSVAGNPSSRGGTKRPTLLVSCKGEKASFPASPLRRCCHLPQIALQRPTEREQGEEESLPGSITALLWAAVNIAACSALLSRCNMFIQHFVLATGMRVSAPAATGHRVPSSKSDLHEASGRGLSPPSIKH